MLEFNFNPFPIIETNNLVLRRLEKRDAPIYFRIRNDDDAMKYISRPRQKSVAEIEEFIDQIDEMINSNKDINWAITQKGVDQLIGTIGFYRTQHEHHRGEIGYMLDPAFWRKGIMNEAIKAVVNYGFETMKLHTIMACINPENTASRELLLKNNFIKEAYFKEDFCFEGVFMDTEVFTKFNQ